MSLPRPARKRLALVMGLILLFACAFPASAVPSDGFVSSDAALAAEPASSDGNTVSPSSGGDVETPEVPVPSDDSMDGKPVGASDGYVPAMVSADSDGFIHIQSPAGYIDDGFSAPAVDENRLPTLLADTLPTPGESFSLVDAGKMTAVRNQGMYGTCWAHAALASAESNLLMQGEGTYDFSELHLVHYTYHRNADVAGILGTTGDTVTHLEKRYNYADNAMHVGGNDVNAVSTLAAGLGPIPEAELPYPNPVAEQLSMNETGLPSANVRQVIEGGLAAAEYAVAKNAGPQFDYAYMVNPQDNPTLVKQLLMTSGAASLSYYSSGDNAYRQIADEKGYYTYYQNTVDQSDHAVTLCGWDDNYPAGNFLKTPAGNGAWLCKNSWGAGTTYYKHTDGNTYHSVSSAGETGYFWLSYYDTSIDDVCFYGMRPAAEGYDHIYQHDGGATSVYSYYDGVDKIAGVFEAKGSEYLGAIRVRLMSANNNITIKAYKNVQDPTKPTASGIEVVAAAQSHYCPYAGTYTLAFKTPVLLERGEDFSVVVEVNDAMAPFDSPYAGAESTSTAAYSGKTFFDAGYGFGNFTEGAQDLHIKALTRDVDYIPTGKPGDVNANNRLDLADAVFAARIVVNDPAPTEQRMVADVVKASDAEIRGTVDVHDVLEICKALVGRTQLAKRTD